MTDRQFAKTMRLTVILATAMLSSAAHAQDSNAGQSLFQALGLTPRDKSDIEYRERSPLVVPPKMDLRQPGAGESRRNAAWPNDPDVQARADAVRDGRRPTPTGENTADPGRTLSGAEIRAGRRAGAGLQQGPAPTRGDNASDILYAKPGSLGPNLFEIATGRAKKDESDKTVLQAGVEPERRNLTEPPTGYRRATESVKATTEPIVRDDPADPRQFQREQRQGR